MKQKVFLYISEIAAYVGQNKYDSVTPFTRVWKRCDSQFYNESINASKSESINLNLKII